jgi:hypothetical protein
MRFDALLRHELLTLLRTRETYTFGVLPAVGLIPASLVVTLLVLSFRDFDVLAVPADLAVPVALVPEDGWEVREVDDPMAAFEAGEASAALLSVAPDGQALAAEVVVRTESHADALRELLTEAAEDRFDDAVRQAGGDPQVDREVATVFVADDNPFEPGPTAAAGFLFFAGYLGCFLFPVRTHSERSHGVLESYAATATPVVWLYAARVLVGTVLVATIVLLPALMSVLIVDLTVPVPDPLDAVEVGLALLFFDTLHVIAGLVATSTRVALYLSSYLVLGSALLFAPPSLGHGIDAAPLLGLVADDQQLVRLTGSVVLLGLAFLFLDRFARRERVLPPGEGDE